MTLTLEISPEVEAEIAHEAKARGVAAEAVAAEVVTGWAFSDEQKERRKRLEAVARAHGMFAGDGRTVDDFLADRHAEGEAEYDKWIERQNVRSQHNGEVS